MGNNQRWQLALFLLTCVGSVFGLKQPCCKKTLTLIGQQRIPVKKDFEVFFYVNSSFTTWLWFRMCVYQRHFSFLVFLIRNVIILDIYAMREAEDHKRIKADMWRIFFLRMRNTFFITAISVTIGRWPAACLQPTRVQRTINVVSTTVRVSLWVHRRSLNW